MRTQLIDLSPHAKKDRTKGSPSTKRNVSPDSSLRSTRSEISPILLWIFPEFSVLIITQDTLVVPRGAYIVNSQHQVLENHNFHGLSVGQSTELSFYFHLRQPDRLPKKTLLEREGLVKITDFADNIAEDVPQGEWHLSDLTFACQNWHVTGVWSINRDSVTNTVTIRSLLWPGYFAFSVANSPIHGSVYFGHGEKNDDIGFLL